MKNIMLRLTAGIVLVSCGTNTTYQSFYKENREFAQFAIGTPAFIANIFIPKEELDEYGELLKKMRHYKVMIFEENNDELNNLFNSFVQKRNYTSLVRVQENGNKVHFFYLKQNDLIKEMVLKVQDENEFVLIGVKTKLYEHELVEILDRADLQLTSIE